MTELWLKFKDVNNQLQNVLVDRESFVIGRSPENDLSIPRSELSRRHAEINRFGDIFVISDCGSSNGTTVNGAKLENPVALKNGDGINLGGGVEVKVELIADEPDYQYLPDESNEGSYAGGAPASSGFSAGQSEGSFPKALFIIAPVLGLVILIFAGGLLFLFGGRKEKVTVSSGNDIYLNEKDKDNKRKTPYDDEDETPTPKPTETKEVNGKNTNSTAELVPTPAPISNDLDKLEHNALPFMRRIAVKDETYVFTRKQLSEINNQIKSFKGSTALRENLKAVKKDASKFEELAKTKGLKPQFLATAALAKIGNQTQNPLTVAQTMLPILNELKITLGNELSDENLLVIAAYNLGEQEKYRAMQMTLEGLSKQTQGVATNKIRTIWFLREKGKLSDEQYAFALKFLAIGAIMQNPKDFNVDTEAVVFN